MELILINIHHKPLTTVVVKLLWKPWMNQYTYRHTSIPHPKQYISQQQLNTILSGYLWSCKLVSNCAKQIISGRYIVEEYIIIIMTRFISILSITYFSTLTIGSRIALHLNNESTSHTRHLIYYNIFIQL